MYIHIGQDVSILSSWLVAVLDLDRASAQSQDFQDFLLQAEESNRLEWLGPEIPRSVVVCLDRIYLSPVRPETLKARFSQTYYQAELEGLAQG